MKAQSLFKIVKILRVSVCILGYASGPTFDKGGSGSNFLCLPEHPQYRNFIGGFQRLAGEISGIEYELWDGYRSNFFSAANAGGRPLHQHPAPCALCYVEARSTIAMIPARTHCPSGWTPEYAGYLVSETSVADRKRSSYVCWDGEPEIGVGGTNQNNAVIYPVQVRCGSLPCSVYPTGRELSCIVCSKWCSQTQWRFHRY